MVWNTNVQSFHRDLIRGTLSGDQLQTFCRFDFCIVSQNWMSQVPNIRCCKTQTVNKENVVHIIKTICGLYTGKYVCVFLFNFLWFCSSECRHICAAQYRGNDTTVSDWGVVGRGHRSASIITGSGAKFPAGSMGRAAGHEVRGQSPLTLKDLKQLYA